jgi:hypothetical protein
VAGVMAELDSFPPEDYTDAGLDALYGEDEPPEPTLPELASFAAGLDEVYGLDLATAAYELGSTGLAADDHDQLAQIGETLDLSYATGATRLAEDAEPLPRRAEDRIARLLDRASAGTYTPPSYFRDPTDLANGDPVHGCGPLDEFGRCGARFHDAYCFETVRTSAATSSHEAASQWKEQLLSNTATATELASRTGPGFDDLLEDPGPRDQATYQRMRELLGLSGKQSRPRPMRPAVTVTPQEMGIY